MSKSTKPKIKAIIFDLGGVLMHGGYLEFLRHYCAICFSPEGKKQASRLERLSNLGKIPEKEFYQKMHDIFQVHMTPKQMHDWIIRKMQTDKRLVHLLPKLKKFKLALFTNSLNHMALEVIKKQHIPAKKLFNKVFVSSMLHIAKPDQSAYRFVLKKLKVKPHEALMVDDRKENIAGAKKVGMHGIVYKNYPQFKKELAKYELV